jgi:pimeloyl-ACP methyl ester carboxylesterase
VVLKGNILALAETGRRVIYVNAPHGMPTPGQPGYSLAEMRKVAALLLALETMGAKQVDVVAHSEGAIVAALAATLRPEKFRNLILINPAGLSKKKETSQLAADFSADVLWGELRQLLADRSLAKTILTAWLEAGKTIAAAPFKAWQEVEAISVTDIAQLLRGLKQYRINVAVIHAKDDKAFPVAEVCAGARSGHVCKIITIPGSHNEFYRHPDDFARMCDKVLISLERRSAD